MYRPSSTFSNFRKEVTTMSKSEFKENLMDQATVAFFRVFAKSLKKTTAKEQYTRNTEAWAEKQLSAVREKIKTAAGPVDIPPYVEYQSNLTWLEYGVANNLERKLFFQGRELTAAENACEVIAVYNALLALEKARGKGGKKRKRRSLPELLYQFSQKGMCNKGVFGTSPKALEKYFREHNFRTAYAAGKQITEEALAEMQENYDTFIMTAFNRGQNPFSNVHTMCITKEKGGYQRHNDYEKEQFYTTVYDAVQKYHGGRGHAICVIAVGNLQAATGEKSDE